MAKQKQSKLQKNKKEELLESQIQEIIDNNSEGGVTLFNQHRLLLDKANRNLDVCKQFERDKLEQGYTWVQIDEKTKVLRKIK